MARGWESKSVEAQQADAESPAVRGRQMSAEERALAQRRLTIELSRARVQDELSRATRPAHRAMLEGALAALDAELLSL
jgi:hypothetical protein